MSKRTVRSRTWIPPELALTDTVEAIEAGFLVLVRAAGGQYRA